MNRRTFIALIVSAIVGGPLYQKFLAWRNPVKRAVPGKIDFTSLKHWFRIDSRLTGYYDFTEPFTDVKLSETMQYYACAKLPNRPNAQ